MRRVIRRRTGKRLAERKPEKDAASSDDRERDTKPDSVPLDEIEKMVVAGFESAEQELADKPKAFKQGEGVIEAPLDDSFMEE